MQTLPPRNTQKEGVKLRDWLKLNHEVLNTEIWHDYEKVETGVFTKRHAWIDLILIANSDDKEVFSGSSFEIAKQGSLYISEHKLSERWKWSRNKVRKFLSVLVDAGMIELHQNNKRTLIKIIKYSKCVT